MLLDWLNYWYFLKKLYTVTNAADCNRLQQSAACTHACTRTHTCTHSRTLTPSLTHTYIHTHIHTNLHKFAHTHSLSLSRIYTHIPTWFSCTILRAYIFFARLWLSQNTWQHPAAPCNTLQHPITHLILLHSLCVLCFRATLIQAGQFALMWTPVYQIS